MVASIFPAWPALQGRRGFIFSGPCLAQESLSSSTTRTSTPVLVNCSAGPAGSRRWSATSTPTGTGNCYATSDCQWPCTTSFGWIASTTWASRRLTCADVRSSASGIGNPFSR